KLHPILTETHGQVQVPVGAACGAFTAQSLQADFPARLYALGYFNLYDPAAIGCVDANPGLGAKKTVGNGYAYFVLPVLALYGTIIARAVEPAAVFPSKPGATQDAQKIIYIEAARAEEHIKEIA